MKNESVKKSLEKSKKVLEEKRKIVQQQICIKNIAGILPANSRNSFVDLQYKKNSKKDRPKKFVFSLKADMLYFD